MKKKSTWINGISNLTENVKPEFLNKRLRNHPVFMSIEIHKDKKYGAIAKLYERNSSLDRFHETITKKAREKLSKVFKKIDGGKRVDTSKWVKPDEESIRNELIEALFFLIIFKEDYCSWKEYKGRAEVIFSILHSHSLRNPQSLTNYFFEPYFEAIMKELKVPEGMKHWYNLFGKNGKKKYNETKSRAWYKKWKSECLKNMIIVDQKPPKFKDIFKIYKKHSCNSKGNKKKK